MRFGYIRCSTIEQNEERQTEELRKYGIDEMSIEKVSGKNLDRPILNGLLSKCRKGDTLIVCDLSRLARNTRDLLGIVSELNNKGVSFISLKESIDFSTATGKLMLTMLSGIYEFERDVMLERQREGIAVAKKNGVYKGRKAVGKPHNFDKLAKMAYVGEITTVEAMRVTKLKKSTFYKFYRQWQDNMEIDI